MFTKTITFHKPGATTIAQAAVRSMHSERVARLHKVAGLRPIPTRAVAVAAVGVVTSHLVVEDFARADREAVYGP